LAILFSLFTLPARAQCTPTWLELTGLPGFDSTPNVIGVLNDGTGDALYAGGNFSVAGGETAARVAKFDGTRWSPLGAGFSAQAYAGTVFNGSLYACGEFNLSGTTSTRRVARWDGSAWQPVGVGFDNGSVYQLFVFGNELYAAGSFTLSGGVACNRIAKWTGAAWQQVGTGFNDSVYCLASYQGQLYAGGLFTAAGATTVSNIARWDGAAWQPLGAGVSGGSSVRGVFSMLEFAGALHVAGGFTSVNGSTCAYAARWDGSAWTPMPFPTGSASNGARALAVFNNELYCGGTMAVSGGIYLARWNGSAWVSVLNSAFNTPSAVTSLATFNGNLYIAGTFTRLNGNAYNRLARFDGTTFRQVGAGFESFINAVTEFDNQLVIGGRFISAGGFPAFHVVRYDGENYLPMGNELLGDDPFTETNGFCTLNGELYAAGAWTVGGASKRVVKWNGSAWVPLTAQPAGAPTCIASYNGYLVVGGFGVGGTGVHVLRFSGTAWVPMGNGLDNDVKHLVEFNGSLYACGSFSASGTTPMSFVARWDGSQWNAVGGSVTPPGAGERASKLAVYNNQLVVGGSFSTLAGVPVSGIARLNGNTWAPFGQGFASGNVTAIASLSGSLIACGAVRPTGTFTPTWVSLWNGSTWTPIGQNFSGFANPFSAGPTIAAAVPFQNELFIGGDFFKAGGRVSSFLAHWGSEPPCIQSSPADLIGCPNRSATLSVVATGVPTIQYQWRRNGQPLTDGPTASGSIISGALTRSLTISGLSNADDGAYDVVLHNGFGDATSNAANLDVSCCPDINEDGNADQDDVAYLVNVVGGGSDPIGIDPDFNQDGNADQDDIALLVSVVAGFPCP